MAIVQNPITGHTRGKYGPSVFVNMYGKCIIRTRPLTVFDPQTEKQLTQRGKLVVNTAYMHGVIDVIRKGWKEEAIGRSAFNASSSYHMMNAMEFTGGEWVMIPSKMMHAKGSLRMAENLAAENNNGQTIDYSWVNNAGSVNASGNDTFCFVCYNITKKTFHSSFTTQKRADQGFSINLAADWSGNEVAIYGFFRSEDGAIVSDDSYLGTVVLK